MLRNAWRPASENAAPLSARMSRVATAGMTNSHLQRDEPAIAIAEHDRVLAGGRVPHRFRHAVGDLGKAASHRLRPAKTRQLRNDHAKRLRQFWRDRVKARAVRQQRVQQKQRRALARLCRIDGAACEKPIHPALSFFNDGAGAGR